MILRRVSVLAVVVGVGLLASGCNGEPAPAESTPLFANEQEAFAAAEQTYRDYVDALNAERSGAKDAVDPRSFLTSSALRDDIATDEALEERGWRIVGDSTLTAFAGKSSSSTSVDAIICVDASGTRVLDKGGADVTPPDRQVRTSLAVEFVLSTGELLIARSEVAETSTCE